MTEDELLGELQAIGLSKAEAQTFVKFTTFGRGITDLFDAPLLKIADGTYLFFAGAYQTAVLGAAVFGRATSGRGKSQIPTHFAPLFVFSVVKFQPEWAESVAAVRSSSGSLEIIRRAMCTSKRKTASLLDDSIWSE